MKLIPGIVNSQVFYTPVLALSSGDSVMRDSACGSVALAENWKRSIAVLMSTVCSLGVLSAIQGFRILTVECIIRW